MTATCTEDEFIRLWNEVQSATEVAKILGVDLTNVHKRRRRIEQKLGIKLLGCAVNSPDFQVTIPNNGVRVDVKCQDGCIIVGSDAHYWPERITTAHRAFVTLIDELKPNMVVMNGDAFDGAQVSRHPRNGWEGRPSVRQELEAVQDRLGEIEMVAGNAKLHWTYGNHDMRFNSRLCAQVPEFEGIMGMNLSDHFPRWKFSTSLMVNGHTHIKHRQNNGIHAAYNNTLRAGLTLVTGHLHSLKVTPWTDMNGTRYGVDTGTLADPWGDQFHYMEDGTRNWRAGFAVLTFYKGKLLPPETCEILSEEAGLVVFRGRVIKV